MTSHPLRTLVFASAAAIITTIPVHAAESCAALNGKTIPASAIELPSSGAKVRSAVVVQPSQAVPVEYCKVLGAIAPVDLKAPDINFQVNLPVAWNGKAVQYGGGGYNGTLVTGESVPLRDVPPNVPVPLAKGYATFGTDSGHQASSLPEIQAFALNDEALINFAYASYKKTRDVAVTLIESRYGKGPSKTYYAGTSEGGREGLTMAQRFPRDYDGIVSEVPVISWVGLQSAGNRSGIMQQNGGWLDASRITLLRKAVVSACDQLDGLEDGIVSNYEKCGSVFNPATLRCPSGGEGDSCLSDRQIVAVNAVHAPYEFPFALANGVTAYPGWGYGGEDQPGGMVAWVSGTRQAAFPSPAGGAQGQQWNFGNGAVRYFIARDPAFNPLEYNPEAFADRVRYVSGLMDSTNPDLSAFLARGGKLIVKEHMADYAQSPFAGIAYYKSAVAKMGQATVDRFFRLYVTPGVNHGGVGVSATGAPIPQYVDLLEVIDAWADKGRAPADPLTQTSQGATAPFAVTASRPMCTYPKFPRYDGSGDPNLAASFSCVAP